MIRNIVFPAERKTRLTHFDALQPGCSVKNVLLQHKTPPFFLILFKLCVLPIPTKRPHPALPAADVRPPIIFPPFRFASGAEFSLPLSSFAVVFWPKHTLRLGVYFFFFAPISASV